MSRPSGAAMERFVRDSIGIPPFAEQAPPDAQTFKGAQEGFTRLASLYGDNQFIFGDKITYADFLIASFLLPFVGSLTEEEKGQFLGQDGGRWARLLHDFVAAGYTAIGEGEVYVPKA